MKPNLVTAVQKIAFSTLIVALSAGSVRAEVLAPEDKNAGLCSRITHGIDVLLDNGATPEEIRASIGPIDGFTIADGLPRVSFVELIKNGVTITFNPKTPEQKKETVPFVREGGRITAESIEILEDKLEEMRLREVLEFAKKKEAITEVKPKHISKLVMKYSQLWNAQRDALPFLLMQDLLDQANKERTRLNSGKTRITNDVGLNSADARPFVELYSAALALMEGYSQEKNKGESRVKGLLHGLIGKMTILKDSKRPEANNWVKDGKILGIGESHQNEIDPIKMNPAPNGLWRPRYNIGQYRTLYNGVSAQSYEMTHPDVDMAVTLQNRTFGGKTPKLGVQTSDGKAWKMKYLIPGITHTPDTVQDLLAKLLGSSDEALTETVINHVLGAIGVTAQPTYPKKSVRMYIDGINTREELEAKLKQMVAEIEKSSTAAWAKNINKVLNAGFIQKDAQGRFFLRVNTVSLELSGGDEVYIGAFDSETIQMTVQARMIPYLDALFGNADDKDGNRSLLARITTDVLTGRMRVSEVLYGLNDMGFAFGSWWWTKNAPNLFKWDLVNFEKSVKGEKVVTTFNAYYTAELFKAITLNDAKWITKLVGQITLEQWKEFFAVSQYPTPVAMFLAHKMHYRIAGMVDILGLDGVAVETNGPGSPTVTLKGRPANFDPRKFTVKGFENCFKNGNLVPCDAVLARFTLDSPFHNFSSGHQDQNGDVAPQIMVLREVPGAVVGSVKSLFNFVRTRFFGAAATTTSGQ